MNLNAAYWPTQHPTPADSFVVAGPTADPVERTVLHPDEPIFFGLVKERGYTPAGHPRIGGDLIEGRVIGEHEIAGPLTTAAVSA